MHCSKFIILFHYSGFDLQFEKGCVAMSAHLGPWGETVVTAAKTSVLESEWG